MNKIRDWLRIIAVHFAAVPLAIIAFLVVATVLVMREPDGHPMIDGGDDDSDSQP